MNRIKFMYENCPDFLRPGVVYYNRGSVEFDNGSKIWSEATTESTGRGRSVALFICDELAHVKRRVQEEMWASILPTLSTGGSCVVMSTPNGDADLFAQLWRQAMSGTLEEGDEPFVPIYVDISEVPGRDEAWQKSMRSKLGDSKFEQEYLCQFLSDDPLLINSRTLLALKGKPPLFTDKGFAFWKEPVPGRTYLIGSDVSEGLGKDFATIQVVELETLEQIAEFRNNRIKEDKLYLAIKWIIQKVESYADPRTGQKPHVHWSFENNSIGAVIGALYRNDEKFPVDPELVTGKGSTAGFRTTQTAKLEACRHLKNIVEKAQGGLVINSEMLVFELKNYVQSKGSYEARHGATDDLVSAMLIVARILKYLSEYEPEVFNKLYTSEGDFYDETTSEFSEPIPFVM